MEEISELNLPEYSEAINNGYLKRQFNICVCCLMKNVPFVKLTSCKHVEFFERYFNFKLEYSESMVCYCCHKMLTKIYQFKKQVETSIANLNDQLQLSHTQPKLTRSSTEIYYTQNSEPIEKETIEPITFEITTQIKVEHDYSDPENDVPLSQIKKKKTKKNAPIKNYEGKIRSIILSEEEMWEERKRDALKERYLNLPYKCENCVTGFDHELILKEHLEKRHNENSGGYLCQICKSVLCSEASFREHTRRHYRRIECVECGARYNTVQSVVTHYSKMHAALPTEFRCQECSFTTQSHRSYRYHRDKHKKKPQCESCGNTFVNNSALKIHMFTVHKASSRVYSCKRCDKVYRARSGLLAHSASVHGGRGAYCAPCRTHFRTENNLRHHLNTHSRHTTDEDKKFLCSVCEVRFLTKTQLREHFEWEHLKNTKHKCTECSKVFKNGTGLKRHLSFVHEKKRPPRNKICDHCGRGFTTMSILRAHIRTHTGERPHSCSSCEATFAHPAALYTHNKLLHSAPKA